MEHILKNIKKALYGVGFVLAVLLISGMKTDSVQAAVSFKTDALTIMEGEVVYLPHYLYADEAYTYYWDEEDMENPVVMLLTTDVNQSFEFIGGNKPGTVTIWAVGDSGAYTMLKVTVIKVWGLQWSMNTAKVGFYPGHLVQSYPYKPYKTGTYRYTITSPVPMTFGIYDYDGNILNSIEVNTHNGSSYIGTLEVDLAGETDYLLSFAVMTGNNFDAANYPKTDVLIGLTGGLLEAPKSVSMHVDTTNVIKYNGDHYYILVGEELPVQVSFSGGMLFYEENYEYGSTDPAVAVGEDTGDKAFVIRGLSSGTAVFPLTTTSLLKDSVTVTVIDPADIKTGDMNVDGKVDVEDLNLIYAVVHGDAKKTKIYDYADVNEDGQLDMGDVQFLMDKLNRKRFADVLSSDWFFDTVEFVAENGIMTGMDDIHFGPYGSLSRAQFALILYRMEGEPEVEKTESFADIGGNEWYADAVIWAADCGIVTGYLDGTFGPADMITREQMAVMMYRYAKYLQYDCDETVDLEDFWDNYNVSQFADEAIRWTIGSGIITGKNGGTQIAPLDETARAEAATIIMRFLEKYD